MNLNTLQQNDSRQNLFVPELYKPPREALIQCYANSLATHPYYNYPANNQRLLLNSPEYDEQGHIVFDNTGPWCVGSIIPTRDEKFHEVLHNIGYPKMCTLDADYRPLHPWWKDMVLRHDIGGVIGKGFFNRWGANYAADSAVIAIDNQHIPHILLIHRSDSDTYAIPGGFLNSFESSKSGALRELEEETQLKITKELAKIDKLYFGLVLDPRTTIHAWVETHLWLFRLERIGLPEVNADDDADEACWFPINQIPDNLYGSHAVLIDMAIRRFLASETMDLPADEQHPL